MQDLCFLSIAELAPQIQRREVSPLEVTRAYLDRIQAVDGQLYSYISLTAERALEDAKAAIGALLDKLPVGLRELRETTRKALVENEPDEEVALNALLDAMKKSGIVARKLLPNGDAEWICPIKSMGKYAKDGSYQSPPFPDLRKRTRKLCPA